jgi:glucokinase
MSESQTSGAHDQQLTVGVDIGGTKVLAGVVDAQGQVLGREQRPTPAGSAAAVEETIAALVNERGERHPVGAVGIGAAGFVDPTRSVVRASTHLAWHDEPLRDRVSERTGLPVLVDNDGNTAGLGESMFGAGVGHRFVLCVTLGTGIGGALVIDDEVYRGANGMAAEFGHILLVPGGEQCDCGNRGCWEEYGSGDALVRNARNRLRDGSPGTERLAELAGGDPAALTGQQVTQAAQDGDAVAIELLREVGEWVGTGLATLTAALDPDCIVLGGGVSAAGELLLAPARETFTAKLIARHVRVEPAIALAALGPDAGFIGAAAMARAALPGAGRPARG